MARKRKEEEVEIIPDKVFKLRLSLKSGVDGVDNYIAETSQHFLEFNITALNEIITHLSDASIRAIDRLYHIASVDDPSIPQLDENKTNVVFEKLMQVVKNAKEVNRLCEEAKVIIDEVEGEVEEVKAAFPETKQVIKPNVNVFEQAIEKAKSGRG